MMKSNDIFYLKKNALIKNNIDKKFIIKDLEFNSVRRDERSVSRGDVTSYINNIFERFRAVDSGLCLYVELSDDVDFTSLTRMFPNSRIFRYSLFATLDRKEIDQLAILAEEAFRLRGYNNEQPWCLFECHSAERLRKVDLLIKGYINYFDFVVENLQLIKNWTMFNSIYSLIFIDRSTTVQNKMRDHPG